MIFENYLLLPHLPCGQEDRTTPYFSRYVWCTGFVRSLARSLARSSTRWLSLIQNKTDFLWLLLPVVIIALRVERNGMKSKRAGNDLSKQKLPHKTTTKLSAKFYLFAISLYVLLQYFQSFCATSLHLKCTVFVVILSAIE